MFFQPVRTVVYIFLNTSIFYDKIHEFHLSSTQLAQFPLYWIFILLLMFRSSTSAKKITRFRRRESYIQSSWIDWTGE